jgi:hypothetical protein
MELNRVFKNFEAGSFKNSMSTILFTMLVLLVCLSFNSFGGSNFSRFSSVNNTIQLSLYEDPALSLEIVMDNGKRILHVSFNGDEGHEGTLKIYNISGILVKESNFELIKSPFYASVDITGLEKGNYKVELTTRKGNHSSNIEIK